MAKFRKIIEATQWFKNGDHPNDYDKDFHDPVSDKIYTAEFRKAENWEGNVVRYYRHPDISGERVCGLCNEIMHVHGWIDAAGKVGGYIVCPGDWIITEKDGLYHRCKPDIFVATYEPVEDANQ